MIQPLPSTRVALGAAPLRVWTDVPWRAPPVPVPPGSVSLPQTSSVLHLFVPPSPLPPLETIQLAAAPTVSLTRAVRSLQPGFVTWQVRTGKSSTSAVFVPRCAAFSQETRFRPKPAHGAPSFLCSACPRRVPHLLRLAVQGGLFRGV